MYLFSVKKLFSQLDCDQLINLHNSKHINKSKDIGVYSFDTSNSGYMVNLSEDINEIYEQYTKIKKAMIKINHHLDFELGDYNNIEISVVKYTVGKVIPRHMDTNGRCTRKVAFVVSLSDPMDYGGGEFYLDVEPQKTIRKPNKGDALVIPAFYPHGVNEITTGERYSLVVLFHGSHPFR